MDVETELADVAELFRVLGNESRLRLLRLLEEEPRTVGAISEQIGMSQPLVSQHLRTLRSAGLVSARRSGRNVMYAVADHHVTHLVGDAIVHVHEPAADFTAEERSHDNHEE